VINVGCFSEDLKMVNVEDYHLWLKLLCSGYTFYGSSQTLAKYRIHDSSSSSKDRKVTDGLIYMYVDLIKLFSQNNSYLKVGFKNALILNLEKVRIRKDLDILNQTVHEYIQLINIYPIVQNIVFLLPFRLSKIVFRILLKLTTVRNVN
jgi:hypothetical protein